MAVTAAQINELRKSTGAGMLDCKKALEETAGDFEKAVDFLRTKGLAAAAKKAGRAATEGTVAAFVSDDLKSGVLLEINSETDFVAKNETFQSFVASIGRHILATSPADVESMLAQTFSGDASKTVQTYVNGSISVIGENIQIRRFAKFDVEGDGCIGSYIHAGGKIGVLVQIASPAVSAANKDLLQGFLRDIAMHTAAAAPAFVSRDQVPTDVLDREKEVYRAKAKESGKPDAIIEKMVDGRLRKYYEEVVLLEQVFVVDGETKVAKVVENAAKDVGAPVTLTGFVRFALGEGIEKAEGDDFATEVAKMAH